MITNNKPFHITDFSKISITSNKPFHISSCSKKYNADADTNSELRDVQKNSTLTSEKKLQFHVSSAFEPILSAVKWVTVYLVEGNLVSLTRISPELPPIFEKMKEEIRDILNAHDELKCNSEYNFVGMDSIYPIKVAFNVIKIDVNYSRFEHYMEVRRKVLSEILEIRCKHGGSKKENEVLAEVDKIQNK
ncbi:hypothetical protein MKW92_015452 [Papaver armeniacum]|nr:hypothetical protein MKW92_015452 [Papaver armeniacum]